MLRIPFILAIAALTLLAGCTTMSPEERTAFCTNTDWHRYGANDGKLGVPSSERADLFADCTRFGHPADITAYQKGRAQGLKEYCTVESGYKVGRTGRGYQNVCPPELESDFLQGLAEGRKDRPGGGFYPRIGIGIGSGGVRTGIGVGIGSWGYYPSARDCYWRDPFPCSWRRHGHFGPPFWW